MLLSILILKVVHSLVTCPHSSIHFTPWCMSSLFCMLFASFFDVENTSREVARKKMYYCECVYVARKWYKRRKKNIRICLLFSIYFPLLDWWFVLSYISNVCIDVMMIWVGKTKNIAINLFILCNYMLSNHKYGKILPFRIT